jgi:hypothetical protein
MTLSSITLSGSAPKPVTAQSVSFGWLEISGVFFINGWVGLGWFRRKAGWNAMRLTHEFSHACLSKGELNGGSPRDATGEEDAVLADKQRHGRFIHN